MNLPSRRELHFELALATVRAKMMRGDNNADNIALIEDAFKCPVASVDIREFVEYRKLIDYWNSGKWALV